MYDVVIIGAGVSGSASARELSRYKVNACVIEKAEDVCSGTSKANSGIVHAGFDAPVGSLMAKLNVKGNEMMEELSKELDFPFKKNGSLVICLSKDDMPKLQELYDRGRKNGVKDLKILSKEDVLKLEPNINEEVYAALYAPTGGIVCPFGLNIALAENATTNGVEFKFNTEAKDIEKIDDGFIIKTNNGDIKTKYIVNAAGVYADKFHNMVSENKINITARKGEYCLLDKTAGCHVSKTIFSLPGKMGKGVLVSPTTHGNLIVGPTSTDIADKEGLNTTRDGLDTILEKSSMNVKNIPMRQVITSFAGLRAHEDNHEFIIKELEDVKGFIDCAGIESPGLTSAPAIGIMVADILKEKLSLEKNPDFIGIRRGILDPNTLNIEERNQLIKEQPAYGNIICRCEMITEGEIIDAIRRPLGAKSLDGVKRRTRAGMGRCQAGFCSPKTMEILERELKLSMFDITKCGGKSNIVVGVIKDSI
ncbi:glycerol-3-phosphate dehydrogenase [Intestinibacter bartlettii DSM 16795]|jgi:glycerol-3-phosphate dehydrogenase|uniref:FAD dependent oxidoreductase n=1 Tax=Intestinibacter bartlettii CAG:1329 TaxID=1263063 RepID=R5XBW1_9FIRM|nr:NAD(P)/FAD-dependent oxidoreductase [Intestinibacter bartlettii]EDQ96747.1 FAD dependent oxidoreductase [Intestinibacter bartlettii DSM 16795]UWO80732.1 NAD(P)/FAD-dependent oxidoreductase [Intestinibacter bartlettii]CDA09889.1 fAD dependent oxidoreductase [Intestinibacter bartlettii CAG:1329]SKA57965.1 glycerol-3-phosphate dehydrogenase [Intestinibacter bartlettii DSM 16795]